jgi:uncharacterized membrane protein
MFGLLHYLRTSLWPVPVLCVLGGVALSYVTVAADDDGRVPTALIGGPDAALVILGTVAASMITLTGIVLTIVLVVVQLAMGQFSPRIVRAILHDRFSQLAIGIFVATFAHAMLAMRKISSLEEGAPVPGLAIAVAFLLVVVSIVALILYVNHIGQSLRVAALIDSVGDEIRDRVDELYVEEPELSGDAPDVVLSSHAGVVFHTDYEALVKAARAADCTLEMAPALGDFVPAGAPLFRVLGDPARLDRSRVAAAVALGPERTMNQDVAYGFRMLVDIAVRALSDPLDPTTAVQAIDRLHDGLRQLARRPFPTGQHRDAAGHLRLQVSHISWDGYVHLAFDEIRDVGAGSVQISRRLTAALEDLLSVAPLERRPPLERQRTLLEAAVAEKSGSGGQREPLTADMQGIGSADELQVPRLSLIGVDATGNDCGPVGAASSAGADQPPRRQ